MVAAWYRGQTGIFQVVQCSYFIVQSLNHDPPNRHLLTLEETEPATPPDTNVATIKRQSCEYIFGSLKPKDCTD